MPKKSILSLDADLVDSLKEQAKVRGFEKPSEYVQDWLKKLSLEKTDIKRIILQIPDKYFESPESLQNWLHRRSLEIVDHYFKSDCI